MDLKQRFKVRYYTVPGCTVPGTGFDIEARFEVLYIYRCRYLIYNLRGCVNGHWRTVSGHLSQKKRNRLPHPSDTVRFITQWVDHPEQHSRQELFPEYCPHSRRWEWELEWVRPPTSKFTSKSECPSGATGTCYCLPMPQGPCLSVSR